MLEELEQELRKSKGGKLGGKLLSLLGGAVAIAGILLGGNIVLTLLGGVILALGQASQMLMTRDVFYTAVTRARELLILVGDDQTAHQMIDNYRQSKRYTALRVRLRKLCGVE